jgi:poly(3-hydroxybutyrate) depolymerase
MRIRSYAAFVAVSALCLVGPSAPRAQSVLSDYETSARAAQVQEAAEWRLSFRPTLQVLQQSVSQLRNLPRVTEAERAQADNLAKAAAQQTEPEARRSLWHAASLLLGRPWSPDQDFLGSMALSAASPIALGRNDTLVLRQTYATARPDDARYAIDLYRSEPTSSATPKKGEKVKALAAGRLPSRGQAQIVLALSDVPDGSYILIGRVTSGSASTEIAQSIYLVRDLTARRAALEARVHKIKGHEAAKAIAEYPFDLADAIRAGRREVISYDFPKAISRANTIVQDLEAGRDPVWQAKGLEDRAYHFPQTGELIPYQVYVPSAWTPDRKWPLVVALHGANLDETNMLGRANGEMQKLAEAHGFVVVAPLGYRLNSGYGSERGPTASITGPDLERRRRSEEDVLQVTALVEAEYNIDRGREYLTGNSMGGGGTWWIGGHHAERWAALAPAAFGWVQPEDAAGLSKVPIMAVVGDHDELGMLNAVRKSVATLRTAGVKPQYVEVPGGTHAGAFDTAMPQIFDFFAERSK